MPINSKALTHHEIRDPIHAFIRLDSDEVKAVNSMPFQRLRNIQQLALTNLIYPGATHKRFEHCLGVMDLAGKIYDTITDPKNVTADMKYLVPLAGAHDFTYWRRVVRMAALFHDVGHLPFSHAAEHLLPDGFKHETISREIIEDPSLDQLWIDLKIQKSHVSKIAVGPKHSTQAFDIWESILSEVIIGDTFGADRIDYLLRDSYHAGVAYGRFDHYRLLDTLRILPKGDVGPPQRDSGQLGLPWFEKQAAQERIRREQASREPTLGVEFGGLQAAEGLLWARYFMWSQVYLHHVRRAYDLHLADFLSAWLPNGKFSVVPSEHIQLTDNEVLTAIAQANRDPTMPGHEPAALIMSRRHFRRIYEANPTDKRIRLDAFEVVCKALTAEFGDKNVKSAVIRQRSEGKHFPVHKSSGICESSINLSETLARLPVVSSEYVFVHPDIRDQAKDWLSREQQSIFSA